MRIRFWMLVSMTSTVNHDVSINVPSQQQLQEAYMKTYPNLQVFKDSNVEKRVESLELELRALFKSDLESCFHQNPL